MARTVNFPRRDALKNHLRSGVTPAQFEMDILRYERLRADAAFIGATRLRWPGWLRIPRLAGGLRRVSRRLAPEPKVRTRRA